MRGGDDGGMFGVAGNVAFYISEDNRDTGSAGFDFSTSPLVPILVQMR